jgi:hypothetical protein
MLLLWTLIPLQIHIPLKWAINYCIAGNFQGRKLARISRFESHPGPAKVFSMNLSMSHPPIYDLAFRESFLRKMLTSSFFFRSLTNVSRYTVHMIP